MRVPLRWLGYGWALVQLWATSAPLWASVSERFDVSGDDFGSQPISRDGTGQAAVLAARDCPGAQ